MKLFLAPTLLAPAFRSIKFLAPGFTSLLALTIL